MPRPTGECSACDLERGILCIDCYRKAEDLSRRHTYAEYVVRAAAYRRRREERRLVLPLTGLLVFACLVGVGLAQDRTAEVRGKLASLKSSGDVFLRAREARRCAESAIPSDVLSALERAARGELPADCRAFTR